MATWDDVTRIAAELPEVEIRGRHDWQVKGKSFAWERPLRKRDLEELGDTAPEPPILAVWVPDKLAKDAMVKAEPEVFFTTSHFDGYAIVLIRLSEIPVEELEEALVEAWLTRAPKTLAKKFLEAP